MTAFSRPFENVDDLARFLQGREYRSIVISIAPCPDYPGMARAVELASSKRGRALQVLVDYSCFGLDAGAPETGMSYTFAGSFVDLPSLLRFLQTGYDIALADIRIKGAAPVPLPSPYDPPEAIARYQEGWSRFEADSQSGALPEHSFPEFRPSEKDPKGE